MMIDRQLDEEKIFHIARGIEAADLREDYLVQICAGDQALRDRVDALLDAHENQQSLLKSNVVVDPTENLSGVAESVGEQIGRYKLLQKIGEGGFGVVYMAEQSRPIRRKVALKVIKPGMDTRAVVARFEAERQALAFMDHPNIAKVFDGGATESGRPYFVMELVKGVPITDFCDENKFTLKQRLELFATVCQAIQHAHQKGIIHRDIKPSNVLVTLHDGVPVPKVIDFGVSKAISQQLTEKTLFTAHGQMIGTPQYMSPEQAEMSGLDIDTRSDIYSLGILLYELLTGCTPLDPVKIRQTAYVDLQRMIREDEPQRPSRRYSTMGNQSVAIATKRQTDPQKLGGQLRGELDLIVMKSLEKDRNRRYDSATEFADDVQRFLSGDSVQACPPSASYRFQKFARKNRSLLVTGGSIAVILLVALISVSVLAFNLSQTLSEREQMVEQLRQEKDYRHQIAIDRAVVKAAMGDFEKARESIAGLENAEAYELMIQGWEARFKGKIASAVDAFEAAHQREPNDVIIEALLASAYLFNGDWESYASSEVGRQPENLKSDYERMFVGNALIWSDPEKGLELLSEAAENTRHPLAYMFRAHTLASLANGSRNRADMEEALDDVDRSATYLTDPDFTLQWQLFIRLHAHDLFLKLARSAREAGKPKDAEELQSRADMLLTESDEIMAQLQAKGIYVSQFAEVMFYRFHGESKEARAFYRSTNTGDLTMVSYALNQREEIDAEIERFSGEDFQRGRRNLCRIILMLEKGDLKPDSEYINKYLAEANENGLEMGMGWVIDLALISGRWPEAEALAAKLYEEYPKDGNRMRSNFFRFHANNGWSADDYLAQIPMLGQGGANYQVGLSYLGRGDRVTAKKYFEDSIEYGIPNDTAREFAEVFLKQIEADDTWPHWIPPME